MRQGHASRTATQTIIGSARDRLNRFREMAFRGLECQEKMARLERFECPTLRFVVFNIAIEVSCRQYARTRKVFVIVGTFHFE